MPTKTKDCDQTTQIDAEIAVLDAELAELRGAIESLNLEDEAAHRGIEITPPDNSLFSQIATAVDRVKLEESAAAAANHRADLRSAALRLIDEKKAARSALATEKHQIELGIASEVELSEIEALLRDYSAAVDRVNELGLKLYRHPRSALSQKHPSNRYWCDGAPLKLSVSGTAMSISFGHDRFPGM